MKRTVRIVIACAFLAGVGYLGITRAQSVGDDLATALANHGVDAVTAPIAAAAIEIAVANNNGLISRLAADEAAIAALKAGASSGPAPSPVLIQVTQNKWIASAQSFSYTLTIPVAGSYQVLAMAGTTVAGKTLNMTFGSTPTGEIQLVPTPSATTYITSAAQQLVSLPAGTVVVTVNCDSFNFTYDGFLLLKQ